jgi:hypothetical protein
VKDGISSQVYNNKNLKDIMLYKYFINFSLSKVQKPELPELTKSMLEIVEKHDPTALKISGMYTMLSELRPLLDILAVKYDGCPNSEEFVQQRKLRNKILGAILSHIVGKVKAGEVETNPQAALAIPYLKSYLKGISSESASVKSGRVNQMLNGLTDNEDMNQALSELGMSSYIEKLRGYQLNVNKGETLRREKLAVRPKFNNKNANKRVMTGIDNMLRAIELAKAENSNLNYMPLVNELNVLLNNRQAIIKSRATRTKNSATHKTATVAMSATTSATAS